MQFVWQEQKSLLSTLIQQPQQCKMISSSNNNNSNNSICMMASNIYFHQNKQQFSDDDSEEEQENNSNNSICMMASDWQWQPKWNKKQQQAITAFALWQSNLYFHHTKKQFSDDNIEEHENSNNSAQQQAIDDNSQQGKNSNNNVCTMASDWWQQSKRKNNSNNSIDKNHTLKNMWLSVHSFGKYSTSSDQIARYLVYRNLRRNPLQNDNHHGSFCLEWQASPSTTPSVHVHHTSSNMDSTWFDQNDNWTHSPMNYSNPSRTWY